MTEETFFIGGADRRETPLSYSAAPEFQLIGLWNGETAIPAYSPVVPEAPFLSTVGPHEEPEVIFSLRLAGVADDDNWGILIDPLENGECGRVVMAGVVAGRFYRNGTPSGYAAPGGSDALIFSASGRRARILCLPGEADQNDLALLLLSPVPGSRRYESYFMLALHDAGNGETSDFRVRVVDGATYDGDTLASSGNSVCKVNNRVFDVAPWESVRITANRIVALRFTPGASSAQDSVEPVLLESLPADTGSAVHFQLGRVIFPAYGQPYVVQDHTSGVAQLWWYLLCQ